MKDDVLQAVIAGAKANGSWYARYGEVSIKEALAPTSTQCEVQPEQEPVAQLECAYGYSQCKALEISQKKRPWVGLGLTVVEIMREWHSANDSVVDFARAIEAKLKEKNT